MAPIYKAHILLVEDEQEQRQLIRQMLEAEQFKVSEADSVEAAIVLLNDLDNQTGQNVDLVFSDWKLAELSGIDLLRYIRKNHAELGFVIATAYGSISHAVEAMKNGADDYLAKPFKRQELLLTVEKALRAHQLKLDNSKLQQQLSEQTVLSDLIGHAPCMQAVFERIKRVSMASATVLINGESGTGKELTARAIHQLSKRDTFIAINCGAIPESLAEAELFGAEKGAYTGATVAKTGKIESAHGGTLFLDEIGELSLPLQTKLLRFLQEGVITKLGSHQDLKVNCRILAATHRDLPELIKQGLFREDLFYRLNVVPITMPPLRNRTEDIPRLIKYFLSSFSKRYGTQTAELSQTALTALLNYHWPGNVRELSNLIERFVLLADEEELMASLHSHSCDSNQPALAKFTLPDEGINWDQFEKQCLSEALQRHQGNKTHAARFLSIPYKAFLYRLEKYKLC